MRLHVEFSNNDRSAHAVAKVQLRDGKWANVKEWTSPGRCIDIGQLDDIFACIACELDIQALLF